MMTLKTPSSTRLFGCFLLLMMISSCVSRRNMVYFQEIEEIAANTRQAYTNNLIIKPDDVLTIRVSAPEQEAAIPFNLTKSVGSQQMLRGEVELETYLVSDQGSIEFPVIGTMEVAGLTNIELSEKIKSLIDEYVKDAIVNVRILNFQISVLGEVRSPGMFSIEDDHVDLSQALAMAGDLTIFGKRTNILVMGQENGRKTYAYLDLTDANVLNSPFYNLRQGDVVYVEPRNSRRQSAGSTGVASTYLSIASVIASLVILLTR